MRCDVYHEGILQRAFSPSVAGKAEMRLQIITPFNIYFNARFVYQKWELWRLLTNFMFFGSLGGSWLHHVIFHAQSEHTPRKCTLMINCRTWQCL